MNDSPAPATALPPADRHRFYEIDLLRFIAAVSVMFFHYTFRGPGSGQSSMAYAWPIPVTKYGAYGVHLFFIISGFVILMSARSESARKFMVSRAARLYPAFWICCTITFAAIMLAGDDRFTAHWRRYISNMSMYFWVPGSDPIDGVYWTLVIEMKFYIFIFLLLLTRQLSHAGTWLGLWLAAVLLFDLGWLPLWTANLLGNPLFLRFSPFFIAGAMFYLIYSEGLSLYRGSIVAVSYGAGIYNALKRSILEQAEYHTSFNPYVITGIISVFFVLFILITSGRTRTLGRPWFAALGALTYPLYLLHQRVGYMIINLAYPHVNRHMLLFGTMALMLACAYLINRFVERPGSKWIKRGMGKWLGVPERRG